MKSKKDKKKKISSEEALQKISLEEALQNDPNVIMLFDHDIISYFFDYILKLDTSRDILAHLYYKAIMKHNYDKVLLAERLFFKGFSIEIEEKNIAVDFVKLTEELNQNLIKHWFGNIKNLEISIEEFNKQGGDTLRYQKHILPIMETVSKNSMEAICLFNPKKSKQLLEYWKNLDLSILQEEDQVKYKSNIFHFILGAISFYLSSYIQEYVSFRKNNGLYITPIDSEDMSAWDFYQKALKQVYPFGLTKFQNEDCFKIFALKPCSVIWLKDSKKQEALYEELKSKARCSFIILGSGLIYFNGKKGTWIPDSELTEKFTLLVKNYDIEQLSYKKLQQIAVLTQAHHSINYVTLNLELSQQIKDRINEKGEVIITPKELRELYYAFSGCGLLWKNAEPSLLEMIQLPLSQFIFARVENKETPIKGEKLSNKLYYFDKWQENIKELPIKEENLPDFHKNFVENKDIPLLSEAQINKLAGITVGSLFPNRPIEELFEKKVKKNRAPERSFLHLPFGRSSDSSSNSNSGRGTESKPSSSRSDSKSPTRESKFLVEPTKYEESPKLNLNSLPTPSNFDYGRATEIRPSSSRSDSKSPTRESIFLAEPKPREYPKRNPKSLPPSSLNSNTGYTPEPKPLSSNVPPREFLGEPKTSKRNPKSLPETSNSRGPSPRYGFSG